MLSIYYVPPFITISKLYMDTAYVRESPSPKSPGRITGALLDALGMRAHECRMTRKIQLSSKIGVPNFTLLGRVPQGMLTSQVNSNETKIFPSF